MNLKYKLNVNIGEKPTTAFTDILNMAQLTRSQAGLPLIFPSAGIAILEITAPRSCRDKLSVYEW